MQAFHALQLEKTILQEQLAEASITIIDLKHRIADFKKRPGKKGGGASAAAEEGEEAGEDEEDLVTAKEYVNTAARKYSIMNAPWVKSEDVDELEYDAPSCTINDAAQCITSDNKIRPDSIRAEIHQALSGHPEVRKQLGRAGWIADAVSLL